MKLYRVIFLCVLPLLLPGSSCSTVRQLPTVADSTRVEIRAETQPGNETSEAARLC